MPLTTVSPLRESDKTMTELTIDGYLDAPLTTLTGLGAAVALRECGHSARLGWSGANTPTLTLYTEAGREQIAAAVIAVAQVLSEELADMPRVPYLCFKRMQKTLAASDYSPLAPSTIKPPFGANSLNAQGRLASVKGWAKGSESDSQWDLAERAFWEEVTTARRDYLDGFSPTTRSVAEMSGSPAYWATRRNNDYSPSDGMGWWVMGEPTSSPSPTQADTVAFHARKIAAMSTVDVLDSIEHGSVPERSRILTKKDVNPGAKGSAREAWSAGSGCGFGTGVQDLVRVFCGFLASSLSVVVPQERASSDTSSTHGDTAYIPLPMRPMTLTVIENLLRSSLLTDAVRGTREQKAVAGEILRSKGVGAVLCTHREERKGSSPTGNYDITAVISEIAA